MHSFGRAIWLASALLVLAGCADGSRSSMWPFADVKDKVPGIKTPDERIAELKQMAAAAAQASPEEQQRRSVELAHEIQRESDPLLRAQIIKTMGAYPTETARNILRAGLSDADDDVRIACCDAWGKRGGEDAVAELSRVLTSDTNLDVRLTAVRALGDTRQKSAMGPLAEALADNDPAIQYRAVESLRAISGRTDLGADAAAWRQVAQGTAPVSQPSIAERLKSLF